MTRILLDEALKSKLNGLIQKIEVCDESGTVVGYFLPRDDYYDLVSSGMEDTSGLSPEERAAARDEFKRHGGYTTAEAIAYLERLTKDQRLAS